MTAKAASPIPSRPRHVIERQLASVRAAIANQAGRPGSAELMPTLIATQQRWLDELTALDNTDSSGSA